jgi:hypothetical protein
MATESWEPLFATPGRCDHFVQLYQDETFLARAVFHFLGAGLAKREGAVVMATAAHGALVVDRLAAAGFDTSDLMERQQLVILDAEDCLARFMVADRPDRSAFLSLVGGVLDEVRSAGFARLRLYGEMVDLLWERNLEATLELEALWSEVIVDQGISLLCTYRIDNFDRNAHRTILQRLCHCHSHLIPVEDYERFDRAVERAYADVFGASGDGATLRRLLMADYPASARMPPAQGALMALRQVSPNVADSVLERARLHYRLSVPTEAPG